MKLGVILRWGTNFSFIVFIKALPEVNYNCNINISPNLTSPHLHSHSNCHFPYSVNYKRYIQHILHILHILITIQIYYLPPNSESEHGVDHNCRYIGFYVWFGGGVRYVDYEE